MITITVQIVQRLAPVIARFLKWAVLPSACVLLCFSTAYAAGWVSKTPSDSPDADLCEALIYRLNHTAPTCIQSAVGAYPGFKRPPWKMLDPNKHLWLIAQLILYTGSPSLYPKKPRGILANTVRMEAQTLVQRGGTLQVWHGRLLNYFGEGVKYPTPSGDQTIVLLSSTFGIRTFSDCPAYPPIRQLQQTFVVLPDLNTPDFRVRRDVAFLLKYSVPVLYKGRTLLISQYMGYLDAAQHELSYGSEVVIYGDAKNSGAHPPVCWLWFNGNNGESEEKNQ